MPPSFLYDYHSVFLSTANVVSDANGYYNAVTINFGKNMTVNPGAEIAFTNGSMYYSWPNITPYYSNNTFSYIVNGVYFPVTLPAGFYAISDINDALHEVMKTNGHFTVDANGNDVFDINITASTQFQSVSVTTEHYYLSFGANFGKVLGFVSGTIPKPGVAQPATTLSDFTPIIQPQSSVLIHCDQVDNMKFTSSGADKMIYAFTPNVPSGNMIEMRSYDSLWCNLITGTYSSLTVRFTDQEFRPLNIIDPSMNIILVIREQIDANKLNQLA